jgi:hypothetical protein
MPSPVSLWKARSDFVGGMTTTIGKLESSVRHFWSHQSSYVQVRNLNMEVTGQSPSLLALTSCYLRSSSLPHRESSVVKFNHFNRHLELDLYLVAF